METKIRKLLYGQIPYFDSSITEDDIALYLINKEKAKEKLLPHQFKLLDGLHSIDTYFCHFSSSIAFLVPETVMRLYNAICRDLPPKNYITEDDLTNSESLIKVPETPENIHPNILESMIKELEKIKTLDEAKQFVLDFEKMKIFKHHNRLMGVFLVNFNFYHFNQPLLTDLRF